MLVYGMECDLEHRLFYLQFHNIGNKFPVIYNALNIEFYLGQSVIQKAELTLTLSVKDHIGVPVHSPEIIEKFPGIGIVHGIVKPFV